MRATIVRDKNKKEGAHRDYLFVYNRLLKYPMFPLTPATKVTHRVRDYVISMVSAEEVTVETEEKFLGILYLIQRKIAQVEIHEATTGDPRHDSMLVKISMRDFAKLFNSNDYQNIHQELKKLQHVSFRFQSYVTRERWATSPVLAYYYDDKTHTIYLKMEKLFLGLCSKNKLCLNFKHYLKLSKTAKNIYKFLLANVDKTCFKISTIKERCNIKISNPKKLRAKLKKCFKEIIEIDFITNFDLSKEHIYITYNRKEL